MFRTVALAVFLMFPLTLNASFIESTIGVAIVEDATATYFNPGALASLKKKQVVALGAMGFTQSLFNGQSTQIISQFTQSGQTENRAKYLLPSLYYAMPLNSNWFLGLAVIGNDFGRDIEGFSILRYAQSNNKVQDVDFIPALSYRFNRILSLGGALYRSRANFLLKPTSGFPSLDIPDIQSRNESAADTWGWDAGFLIKPTKKTIIGFNYRSAMTFALHGTSTFESMPPIVSNGYHFNYWIPARTAVSVSHFINSKLGFIGTVQYIQWEIFDELTIYNLATRIGVLPLVVAPHHYHNSWLFTVGSNYRMTSKWIIRAAGSYLQSPSDGAFQIDNGDSITLGASMTYVLFKHLSIDCSYAHSFIQGKDIRATITQNIINGRNIGAVDAFALKLTMNI